MVKKSSFLSLLLTVILVALAACTSPAPPPTPGKIPTQPPALPSDTLPAVPPASPAPGETPTPSPAPTLPAPPLPETPAEAVALGLVYRQQETLWYWLNGSMTQLGTARSASACSMQVAFSDDGEWVSFVNDDVLQAVRSDASQTVPLLDTSQIQTLFPLQEGWKVGIQLVQWVPNTHGLLAKTYIGPSSGPFKPQDDLYYLNTDTGEVRMLLAPGKGGDFYPSPDGKQVAVSGQTQIRTINIQTASARTLLEYPQVQTGDTNGYYPPLAWKADGKAVRLALSPEKPLASPNTPIPLWELPIDGSPAVSLGSIHQGTGLHPVYFGPGASQAVFISDMAAYPQQELQITRLDGSQAEFYSPKVANFIGWLPDSQYFLYNLNTTGTLGQPSSGLAMRNEIIGRWFGLLVYDWVDPNYWLVKINASWKPKMALVNAAPALDTAPAGLPEVCDFTTRSFAGLPTPTLTPTGPTPTPSTTPTPTETATPLPTEPVATSLAATTTALANAQAAITPEVQRGAAGELILTQHRGRVTSLAFSPNGSLLPSAGVDSAIKLWNPADGSLLRTLRGHNGSIYSLAFNPGDSKMLASTGDNSEIFLWDISLRTLAGNMDGQSGTILHGAFNPAGSQFVTGAEDGSIAIWNVGGLNLLYLLQGHTRPVQSVTFSSNGSQVISAGLDGALILWETSTGQYVRSLQSNGSPIRRAAFSPDGKSIAFVSDDGHLRLWDQASAALVQDISVSPQALFSLVYSPNGRYIALGGEDQQIYIYNSDNLQLVKTFSGHSDSILALVFSPNGSLLASASRDATIRLWPFE